MLIIIIIFMFFCLRIRTKLCMSYFWYGFNYEPIFFLFFSFCIYVKNLQHKGLTVFSLHLTWNFVTETYVTPDVKLDPDCVSSQKRLNSYETFSFFFFSFSLFFIKDTNLSVWWYNWLHRQATDVLFFQLVE